MNVVLKPGEKVTVEFDGTDGEVQVFFEESVLRVLTDVNDASEGEMVCVAEGKLVSPWEGTDGPEDIEFVEGEFIDGGTAEEGRPLLLVPGSEPVIPDAHFLMGQSAHRPDPPAYDDAAVRNDPEPGYTTLGEEQPVAMVIELLVIVGDSVTASMMDNDMGLAVLGVIPSALQYADRVILLDHAGRNHVRKMGPRDVASSVIVIAHKGRFTHRALGSMPESVQQRLAALLAALK